MTPSAVRPRRDCREDEKKGRNGKRARRPRSRAGSNSLAEEGHIFSDVRVARSHAFSIFLAVERGHRASRLRASTEIFVEIGTRSPSVLRLLSFPLSLFILSNLGKEPRGNSSRLCLCVNYLLGASFANYGY